jgi:hypothetical protein
MLYSIATQAESVIVYNPACEFVKQFYNERCGDIVLNPLDRECLLESARRAAADGRSPRVGCPFVFAHKLCR